MTNYEEQLLELIGRVEEVLEDCETNVLFEWADVIKRAKLADFRATINDSEYEQFRAVGAGVKGEPVSIGLGGIHQARRGKKTVDLVFGTVGLFDTIGPKG